MIIVKGKTLTSCLQLRPDMHETSRHSWQLTFTRLVKKTLTLCGLIDNQHMIEENDQCKIRWMWNTRLLVSLLRARGVVKRHFRESFARLFLLWVWTIADKRTVAKILLFGLRFNNNCVTTMFLMYLIG